MPIQRTSRDKQRGRSSKDSSGSGRDSIVTPRKESLNSRRRSTSSNSRPPTRRNPKDMPRAKSVAKNPPDNQKRKQIPKSSLVGQGKSDQHEYLQFSLRITEDIIKNDYYTNEQIKNILNSHYSANLATLDRHRMATAIVELCEELNLPVVEVFTYQDCIAPCAGVKKSVQSIPCICKSGPGKIMDTHCECITDRQPPIECQMHPSLNEYECAVQCIKPNDPNMANKSSYFINCRKDELEVLHKAQIPTLKDSDTLLSDKLDTLTAEAQVEKVDDNEKPINEIEVKKDEAVTDQSLSTSKSSKAKIQTKSNCKCGSPSCDPSTCDDISDKKIYSDTQVPVTPEKEIEEFVLLPVDDSEYDENEGDETTDNISKIENSVDSTEHIKYACKCNKEDCIQDKFKMYLDHYNKKMKHAENMSKLKACHFISNIAPDKPHMCDLCIQTSTDNIPQVKKVYLKCCSIQTDEPTPHVQQQQHQHQNCTTIEETLSEDKNDYFNCSCKSQSQINNNDPNFLIFNGPIYIPKDSVKKNKEIMPCNDTMLKACTNGINQTRSEPQSCGISSGFVSCPSNTNHLQNIFMKCNKKQDYMSDYCGHKMSEPWFCKESHVICPRNYNDYDLTPQKDTFLESTPKYADNCSCVGNKTTNLLLSNRYNRYTAVTEHLSHFYPTIATQVSSMELLTNEPIERKNIGLTTCADETIEKVGPQKIKTTDINNWTSPILSTQYKRENAEKRTSGFERIPIDEHVAAITRKTDSEADVLKRLDEVIKVESTGSMDTRIESLKQDIERFREGNEHNVIRSKEDITQPRDRGVSIGGTEIELIKHIDNDPDNVNVYEKRTPENDVIQKARNSLKYR